MALPQDVEIMRVLETERLTLRQASTDDAEFILELVNDPSFIRNIGDRGVRTIDDAARYVSEKLVASYERFGFGLWLVELKATGEAVGLSGLVKRDSLPDVDIGYAFLPRHWSRGYAFESAAAVMEYGRDALGLRRVVAITSLDNAPSIKVLEKLGLRFDRVLELSEGDEVKLFVAEL
jgi:[ribosomal protein S5]-alanine N-acetyltransferase